MAWLQFSLRTDESKADFYSECLMKAGAVAVTLQDAEDAPLFEPSPGSTPLWGKTKVIGLFDAVVDVVSIKKYLKNLVDPEVLKTLDVEFLEEKNWVKETMAHFHPIQFGKNLWVCPSWCEVPDPEATTILLDPGMAFGTGTHPTTQLCLEWLSLHPPTGLTVIDYGCGSGILAIAALKLGASNLYAIDNDPQALTSTKANAKKNHLDPHHLITALPHEFHLDQKVDLILANILANALIELASTFAELLKVEGVVVLSGILKEQVDRITECYSPWFKIEEVITKDNWSRIIAVRLPAL